MSTKNLMKQEELELLKAWGSSEAFFPSQEDINEYINVIHGGNSNDPNRILKILLIVKRLLELYIQDNYSGPPFQPSTELSEQISTLANAFGEEELNPGPGDGEEFVENMRNRKFVWIAQLILQKLEYMSIEFPSIHWWLIRTYFLHQKFLEEKSAHLWSLIQRHFTHLEDLVTPQRVGIELTVSLCAEMAEIYSFYYDVETAKKFLGNAKEACGISTKTTGVLGKRTRFQQTKIAQLVLNVEVVPAQFRPETSVCSIFPTGVILEDEDRLDRLELEEEQTMSAADLSSTQTFVILSEFLLMRKYLPHDGVYLEELSAYLRFLIEKPKDWGIQLLCLLHRSVLELDSRRTVERSMKQLEVLQKAVGSESPGFLARLKYFFGLSMPAKWEIEVSLVYVLSSLNLFKEALDISLRLNLWEDVISCYTGLNLRHKAKEVIQEKIEKDHAAKNIVKLWILLGDATDCPEHYEKAWELSKQKSARAQRQWGNFYFVRKEYAKAIPHLQKSIELNPLENPTWIRLGYSALVTEDWALSTRAYQHSSSLDGDNFEIWNNLAHGFVKLNEKKKALRALKEASKCNYENWKVWENTLVVATDCRAFDEVIRSYNRLLDLKGKWADEQVLELLVRAIVTNMNDSAEQPSRDRYYKDSLKLFGRITSMVTNNPKIWKLYSDLLLIDTEVEVSNVSASSDSYLNWSKGLTYAQKAIEYIISEGGLTITDAKLQEIVDLTVEYVRRVKDFHEKYLDTSSDAVEKAGFCVRRVFGIIQKRREKAIVQEGYDKYLETIKSTAQMLNLQL